MNCVKNSIFSCMLLAGLCFLQFTAIANPSIKKWAFYNAGNAFIETIEGRVPADSNSLKQALKDFMGKVDSGKFAQIIPYYDSNFLSIRVADAGQFSKMNYSQMIYFWKMISGRQSAVNSANQKPIVTLNTTIHYIEILGDTAYVLLTRVKDLGNGPEPMFYNLVWINKNDKWYLFREIVHQRTMPNFR